MADRNKKLEIEAQSTRLQAEVKALCALLGFTVEESEDVEREVQFAIMEVIRRLRGMGNDDDETVEE
jgi:hypothetical protein